MSKRLFPFVCVAALVAAASPALAADAVERTLCVYDPSGANGDVFNLMKDFRTEALKWGVDFDMKPYTDEKTASEDFKAGKCQAVLMTGTRGRSFHKFAGTLEAMGALPDYKLLRKVVLSLAKKGAAKLMTSGDYESAAIFPGGAVYMLVRDGDVDTVEELAGKKLATLDFDEAAKVMVKKVGASLVPADVSTFGGMFNNGSVEVAYAPATAYQALELYKGVGDKGAVIRYPLAQMTLQLLIRSKDFPEGFGEKSRAFAASKFDQAMKMVHQAEKKIPAKAWKDIPAEDKVRYDEMFLKVRVELRDGHGRIYHPTALKLMRKARCQADATRAECALKQE